MRDYICDRQPFVNCIFIISHITFYSVLELLVHESLLHSRLKTRGGDKDTSLYLSIPQCLVQAGAGEVLAILN